MGNSNWTLEFASDSSLMARLEGDSDLDQTEVVLGWFRSLQTLRAQWPILNFHPAFASLLIDFDPARCDPLKLKEFLEMHIRAIPDPPVSSGRLVDIMVQYGGSQGEDLRVVAHHGGLSEAEVIRRHASAQYRVAFLGFSPGFPYLRGLDPTLFCPRRRSPRTRVPAGSVAIAGHQAGIYPMESPGGWQVIGRTHQILFDPRRDPPTLLEPGDRVRFVPRASLEPCSPQPAPRPVESAVPTIEVLDPGFFSTIQDLGRPGWAHLGIATGGAADPLALRIGNAILGNFPGAAALEMTASGGNFLFLSDALVAVTGADCQPQVEGLALEMWTARQLVAGQTLTMSACQGNFRSYLCVRGGWNAEKILESRSPLKTQALQPGDRLTCGEEVKQAPSFRSRALLPRQLYSDQKGLLRVTRGPQWDWFARESHQLLFAETFTVGAELNRLGLRLNGPELPWIPAKKDMELESEGVANGAIQVAAAHEPMILFCEQQTTGGYPKIAQVIRADWHRLGQLKPGDQVRFKEVDFAQAWALHRDLEHGLRAAGYTI